MAGHRVGVLKKVVVVAVAILGGIAGWGVGALAQVPPAEYKCRVIAPGPAVNEDVTLEDQFDTAAGITESVTVMQPLYVCSPALKNGVGDLTLPDLKCYKIVPSGPPIVATVDLEDQFGSEDDVLITAPIMLCTQVTKSNLNLLERRNSSR